MRTQLVVAQYLQAHGWPHAESCGPFRAGSDILGTPGLAIEVKARADLSPMAWVKQASLNDGLPLVCFRPNGMGEETTPLWPCIIRLGDLVELLRAAGYGDPDPNDKLSASHSRPVFRHYVQDYEP